MSAIDRWKNRPGTSVLGLMLGHDRLEAVELRRSNGGADIRVNVTLPLESDPFSGDPEAAGRQLRKQLDAAGIREHRCVVSLPPDIVLCLTLPLPEIPEADRASLLQIEAERGFPQNPEDLIVESSVSEPVAGSRYATLLAVPRSIIQRLELVLRAARLRPISLTLGLAALQPAADTGGVLALVPTGRSLALQVTHARAVAALRVIDEAFTGDAEPLGFDAGQVLREIRITLGQLPAGVVENIRTVRVFGPSEAARTIAEQLGPRLAPTGLAVEHVRALPLAGLAFKLPPASPASSALAVAVAALAGKRPAFEFLPPRISAWQQFASRYSSRRLAGTGAVVGSIAGVVCLAFLGQQILIWQWQARWDLIKSRVAKLESMQKEIRTYRPWFDESCRSLAVLRRLTESFPEDGSVAAKVVEIRANGRITCSGTARDAAAWLRMRDQLSNAKGIADVQVEQVRGKSPIEFTVNFRWEGPGGS